jgi:hypothetical protein
MSSARPIALGVLFLHGIVGHGVRAVARQCGHLDPVGSELVEVTSLLQQHYLLVAEFKGR